MTVEYTKELTASIVGRYVEVRDAGADYEARTALVVEIAGELGVSDASVRAKLVSEKVYKRKAKTASAGSGEAKAVIADALRAVTGAELKSIEKATKVDLEAIFNFINTASDAFNAERGLKNTNDLT